MDRAAHTLRWIGLVGIASVATMRALTAFAPEVYFDVDPAQQFAPLAALSPAGSLVLDVLLLLACACALAGEFGSGRGLEWKLLLMALLPTPIVLWHGWHDLGDLWRGSTWLAAATALVAAAHLSRDSIFRLALLCVLIAIIGPLLVRGFVQITIEHPATVTEFERTREQFLASRGWEPESPAAQIYERRLRQAQPTGWFTTTNIYASVMATGLISLFGLAIASFVGGKERLPRGLLYAMAATALASGLALVLTGSKGAMLAVVAAACIVVFLASPMVGAHARRAAPLLLLAVVAMGGLGVVVRGAILPEDFLGDRSLLFRWHYLVSSWDIFRHAPMLGIGPDGFQEVYTRFRVPRNPEEVTSAHSVFADWLTMLGALSAAWVALALLMLWRAGAAVRGGAATESDSFGEVLPTARNVAAAAVVFGAIPAVLAEFHILNELHLFLRIIGVAAFLGVAAIVGIAAQRLGRRAIAVSLAGGAAVLLMHAQIEMTFFQPGVVVWAMCFLGVAGGVVTSSTPAASSRTLQRFAIAVVVAVALWISITGVRPSMAQQSKIAEAAEALHPPLELRSDRHRQREEAAALLVAGYEAMPTNTAPLLSAIRQLEIVAADLHGDERIAMLERAHALADRAVRSHRHSRAISDRAAIRAQLGVATADARYYDAAVEDLRLLTAIDPHGIQSWSALGQLLWLVGRHEEAVVAYERALENDANFELDPLKRLPEAHREQIRQRIAQAKR